MAGLNGKVAVVTGAASGIGRAVADLLVAEGAKVAAMDLPEACEAMGDHGFVAWPIDLDVSDTLEPAMDAVVDRLGRCDILVNSAAVVGADRTLADVDIADWARVYRINVLAPMLLMKAFARHAVARGGGGRIVNISSSSGHRARMSPPVYGSSKAALSHLTRQAASELGLHDINVNAVAPGVTATPMINRYYTPEVRQQQVSSGPLENMLHRVSEPQDVAAAVVFLCKPESRQITGQVIHTSAGLIT